MASDAQAAIDRLKASSAAFDELTAELVRQYDAGMPPDDVRALLIGLSVQWQQSEVQAKAYALLVQQTTSYLRKLAQLLPPLKPDVEAFLSQVEATRAHIERGYVARD